MTTGEKSSRANIWERLSFLAIAGCFVFSRLYNLRALPIFLDEADAIQRSFDIWRGVGPAFWSALNVPLMHGKVLHILLDSQIASRASDPVWASRLVSVAAGMITFLSCYVIGKRLLSVKAGLLSALLYTICPFGLFYDRIALSDSLLCAGGALVLATTLAYVQSPSRMRGIALGLALGLAPLAKITGVLSFLLPPLAYWILDISEANRARSRKLAPLVYAIGVICVTGVYLPGCLLSPDKPLSAVLYLTIYSERSHTMTSLAAAARERWYYALHCMTDYFTPSLLMVAGTGALIAILRVERRILFLGSACALLVCCQIAVTSTIFPRYFVWASVPVLVLVAATLISAGEIAIPTFKLPPGARVAVTGLILLLAAVPGISLDYRLMCDLPRGLAELPEIDRVQYVESWPSGYGVEEAARFIRAEARRSPQGALVLCPEYGSTSRFGLKVLLSRDSNISVDYSPMRGDAVYKQVEEWASTRPTYVVFERPPLGTTPETTVDMKRLRSIAKRVEVYPKPGLWNTRIEVYEVIPPSALNP